MITKETKKKCWLCDSENIVNESCARCHQAYCKTDMSRWDCKYCDDCMRDVTVITGVIDGKANIEWNEDNGETIVERGHKCRIIQFQGIDWMFLQHRIHNISDKELADEIEVHKAILTAMINEMAQRQVASLHASPQNKPQRTLLAGGKMPKKPLKTPEQMLVEKLLAWAEKNGFSSSEEVQAFIEGKKQ